MNDSTSKRYPRRQFLGTLAAASAAGLVLPGRPARSATRSPKLKAGQGVVDITPPTGIEMGGFHRSPGNERRVLGIRQASFVRAIVLTDGETTTAVVSVDVATIGQRMAVRVRAAVARQTGVPAENVQLCATHTHSMPAFNYLRQWGAIPLDFMATVEKRIVEAVQLAKDDLASAELALGTSRAVGGNFNRTSGTWKTDDLFNDQSTDAERWLDTTVHALHFRRSGDADDLLWYHFSAHSVCFADGLAGPDWPGMVADRIRDELKLEASFLQGHAGDVNPGDGTPWRGDADETVAAVYKALRSAVDTAQPVEVDAVRIASGRFDVPYNMELFDDQVRRYREDASKCASGEWVDAGFAADWFKAASKRDPSEKSLPASLGALRLGDVGLIFHPAELYSYYGLAMRRAAVTDHTLVVGYTNGILGYLTDPAAYIGGEYAAITVPKILDYPPFQPTAAAGMATAGVELLKGLSG